MKTELFVICDAATDSGGKLNILGVFDTIFAKSVPAVHPHCAIAVRLRLTSSEQGDHKVNVSLLQEDGKNVGPPMEVTLKFALSDAKIPTGTVNYIVNLQGLKLEHSGEYSIKLTVDGKHLDSIPLYIKQQTG
jgi:hypothetical protein